MSIVAFTVYKTSGAVPPVSVHLSFWPAIGCQSPSSSPTARPERSPLLLFGSADWQGDPGAEELLRGPQGGDDVPALRSSGITQIWEKVLSLWNFLIGWIKLHEENRCVDTDISFRSGSFCSFLGEVSCEVEVFLHVDPAPAGQDASDGSGISTFAWNTNIPVAPCCYVSSKKNVIKSVISKVYVFRR